MTTPLPYGLERTVRIAAPREIVFSYFTDSERWASWWGAGSTIDPTPGGRLLVRYPNAVEAVGEVQAIEPPERIVFTMGYPSGKPFPPGASRVTITLEEMADGTLLRLNHATADAESRDQFVQGWRYQLSLLANVVLDTLHTGAAARVDEWFRAMSAADAAERARLVPPLTAASVSYRDRYSCVDGIDDLLPHIDAMHQFMPGFTLERRGDVRHRQGCLLVEWAQRGPAGGEATTGIGVIELAPDGRIARITMFT